MPTHNDSKSKPDEFELLTEKQAAVLGLLAKSLTSKEIAAKLGTSESAVNRHIEILRSRFGGITRAQLAQRYRERPGDFHQIAGAPACVEATKQIIRSEEHTSELQSLMRISYAVFCLKKKTIEN